MKMENNINIYNTTELIKSNFYVGNSVASMSFIIKICKLELGT